MTIRPGLNRIVGTAAGSALALALLVCGCVFAALTGPALSLHTRTQALHQTEAGFASTTKTLQVTGTWGDFTGSLHDIQPGQNLQVAVDSHHLHLFDAKTEKALVSRGAPAAEVPAIAEAQQVR